MLLPRRISEKKCRFTAKKITFLEYQRVKRLELTKNITERKRLGSVLFLPEAVEQGNSLSHESIQRILHQGSLFHYVKTSNNSLNNYIDTSNYNDNHQDALCNIAENNLKESIRGSLNDLLYGKILNVRCLNNHDLCILLSYLINVSEFSEVKCSLLLKVLEQINLNFNTLSISEISHILYNITQLNKLTDKYKIFTDLCYSIVVSTVRLLFTGTKLNNLNFVSSSNVSKILYTLTQWDILDLNLDFKQILKVYLKYFDPNKPNSKEYSLICKSVIKLKSPDYEILKTFSDYYYCQLFQFNLNIKTNDNTYRMSNNNKENKNNVDNNYINNNLNILYCFDKMDEKINLNDLFILLETNEYFGINHSNLLNEFDKYITKYLNIFTSNTRILINMYNKSNIKLCNTNNINSNNSSNNNNIIKSNTISKYGYMGSRRKKMLINLLKNDNYLKNNKLNLQKIYNEITKIDVNNDHLWNLEVIEKINRYVNKRYLFKKYVKSIGVNIDISNNNSGNNSSTSDNSNKDKSNDQNNELIRGFMEAIEYLPKIINYNNIWKIFKIINEFNRIDLVPMFYSYLCESSIIFDDLEKPSDDLYGIFKQVIENKNENYLVILDNICKIIETFSECDLNRDYIGIKIFYNMFNILVIINRLDSEIFNELNTCGSLSFIKEILENYFEKYSKVKVLEFENIPSKEICNKMFRFIPKIEECKNVDYMMLILEEFRSLEKSIDKVVESNIDVFKFVIYNGFISKMEEK